MTRKRHPSARTTPQLRREIQQSGESNAALAFRFGINPKTVAKWKGRPTTSDARMGPKQPVSNVLNAAEEALIVVFRKRTRLPLDDCLAYLKPAISDLSRSALHRCLNRYGVSRVPKGLRQMAPEKEDRKDYGRFTIEMHALPVETGRYLYTAINNHTYFVFSRVSKEVSAYATAALLSELINHAPVKVRLVETNNHEAFANPKGGPSDPEFPSIVHPFYEACLDNEIFHCVTKSKNPAPKMVSKGWRGVPRRRELQGS